MMSVIVCMAFTVLYLQDHSGSNWSFSCLYMENSIIHLGHSGPPVFKNCLTNSKAHSDKMNLDIHLEVVILFSLVTNDGNLTPCLMRKKKVC